MKTGVIIARFQAPYLHEGHKNLIDNVKSKHSKLIVVLGVSPVAGSRKNPYDYPTRERMLKKDYPEVIVLPLSDHPSDDQWSAKLDQMLEMTFPTEEFIVYGSRDSFITHYTGQFPTMELPQHGGYNSTAIRKQYANKVFDSQDFRAGILYAYHQQYTKVCTTVDVAVFRNNKTEILLGRKPNSPAWRFPGGFSDPEDDNFEAAALRELKEECGDLEVGEMQYEMSAKVDDWRYRSEADKIITLLYSCDYVFGRAIAQDDIEEVRWFSVRGIPKMLEENRITIEHIPMVKKLTDKYLIR